MIGDREAATAQRTGAASQAISALAGDSVSQKTDWYAVYVRSRHEFVVCTDLQRKGIRTFLPSYKAVRQWKDRKKTVEVPLFPGYVFVEEASGPGAFFNILTVRGVVSIISQEPGKPTPVAPDELHVLRLLVQSGREIDVYPTLQEGTRVRVTKGPLKDAEGILWKKMNESHFLINISLLGRSVSVRLSAQDIEAQ